LCRVLTEESAEETTFVVAQTAGLEITVRSGERFRDQSVRSHARMDFARQPVFASVKRVGWVNSAIRGTSVEEAQQN
jgi:hypothetical protein